MSKPTIGVGVIGLGYWGPNHVRTFSAHREARVVMCAERDEKRREQMRQRFPGMPLVAGYEEVLASSDIQAVVVATPTATHYEVVKAALEAGKDVLCEKPITVQHREAQALTELAEARGSVLMVGHIFLFNNGILELRRIMQSGELGQTYYMHSARTNLGPFREDVNVVYDLASHDISIFNLLIGTRPNHVAATGMNYLQGSIEDIAFITLYYPNHVIANCHVSWLHPQKVRQLTVVGDRSMATWNDLGPTGPLMIYSKKVDRQDYADYGEYHILARDGDIRIPYVPQQEPMVVQTAAFLEAVRTRQVPISGGRFAADVVAVLEAANLSIRANGRATPLID